MNNLNVAEDFNDWKQNYAKGMRVKGIIVNTNFVESLYSKFNNKLKLVTSSIGLYEGDTFIINSLLAHTYDEIENYIESNKDLLFLLNVENVRFISYPEFNKESKIIVRIGKYKDVE